MTVEFHYGVMAPKLAQQAKAQGVILNNANQHQKNVEAMQRLYICNYITETEKDKIICRLHKDICHDCAIAPKKAVKK